MWYRWDVKIKFAVDLMQNGIVGSENWFKEANNHETRVSHLLPERNLGLIKSELVGSCLSLSSLELEVLEYTLLSARSTDFDRLTRKVSVRSGNETVVVNNNQCLVRDLSLGILEDTIAIDVPRIVNASWQ